MNTSRRDVLKMAGVALAGSAIPTVAILNPNRAFAGVNAETLKVGLIGCGGRGSGAANQALKADPNVVLHAMGDIFKDKLDASHANLTKVHGKKVQVDEGRKFIGFDAFKKVLDSGVDVVLLASPPHFRPEHLTATINAGKHVFCEKPVAVDAPGVRKVLEAAKLAKQKNLSLMSGFCWRYHEPKRASFARILDGAVGDITAIYNTYDTGTLWSFPRVAGWTDAEYVLRNWTYYTWLAGDHIVEQAVHSIDMMSWAMGGKLPLSATGTGGRQVRTDSLFGNIFDHFAVTYEYENGVKGFHHSRQQANCENSYLVETLGTKGRAMVNCARNVAVFRALDLCGDYDRMPELLGPWHEMIDYGLDTFVEENSYWRSLCHAWSAHPAIEFVERVLGITAAEPGYTSIDIVPHRCGLTEARGGVCTPQGRVQVSWKVVNRNFYIEIDAPAGVSVHVRMPNGTRTIEPGGHIHLSCNLP